MSSNEELVAHWNISLSDGKHRIEFEHGTTSGRRVIRVNGKEIFRTNWMFKLVGREQFTIGKHKCEISIDSSADWRNMAYEYSLEVDGKSYEKFCENQSKVLMAWSFAIGDNKYRVALEKNTMDLYLNGKLVEAEPQFIENGTETQFDIDEKSHLRLITVSSGNRRSGLVHCLFINDKEIPHTEG